MQLESTVYKSVSGGEPTQDGRTRRDVRIRAAEGVRVAFLDRNIDAPVLDVSTRGFAAICPVTLDTSRRSEAVRLTYGAVEVWAQVRPVHRRRDSTGEWVVGFEVVGVEHAAGATMADVIDLMTASMISFD